MASLSGFDASTVEPAVELEPLPADAYIAVIVASEMKPTKAGTGSFLELKFQVLEGEFKSRHLWDRLNLENPNPLAVQIARAELSAICRAVGVMAPGDSTDLHDLPLQITVKCKKRSDTGELVNEITGYKPKPAVGEQTPQSGDTPPWKRSA